MIDRTDNREFRKVYTYQGKGRWIVLGYCEVPSVTMVDLEHGKRMNFGLGGLMDQDFKPIRDQNADDLEDFLRVIGTRD